MEQALTNGAAGAAPSTLELLLGADVVSIKANLPTARYEISRLSEAAGAPVVFTLRALPYGRVQELKRLTEESDIQILLAGCAEPDLKAAALQEKFQGVTPAETVKAMLLPGEIADLAIAVRHLLLLLHHSTGGNYMSTNGAEAAFCPRMSDVKNSRSRRSGNGCKKTHQ